MHTTSSETTEHDILNDIKHLNEATGNTGKVPLNALRAHVANRLSETFTAHDLQFVLGDLKKRGDIFVAETTEDDVILGVRQNDQAE